MLVNWGRLALSRWTARCAIKPLGSQIRIGAAAGQLQPIAQQRSLAAAAGSKKPVASKKTTAKKAAPSKRTSPRAKRAIATAKKGKASQTTKKTTATKKAAPKKTTKKATATKKPASKKAVAPKRASPGRPKKKKERDPDEVKKEKEKELIKALKEKILDPPRASTLTAWNEFFKAKIQANKDKGVTMGKLWKEHGTQWHEEYANLPQAEFESLKQAGVKRGQAASAALREWVTAHTPAEIHEANQARARLSRLAKRENPPHGLKSMDLKQIPDERFPKQPRNELVMFVIDRLKNYTGPAGKEKMNYVMGLGSQYKTLSDKEKSKYIDLAAQDRARYAREMKNIGLGAPPVKKTAKA